MAIIDIPTGSLPYEVVDKLPKNGEENKIYGVPQTIEGSDFTYNINYRWHNGAWQEVDLGANIPGFLFADYQESVQETVAEMEQTIVTLENTVEEQSALIQELEEAVFPTVTTRFPMSITSLMAVELSLYDENDEIIPNHGMTTEYWEEPQFLTYIANDVKKGTYYLKNADGYALGKSNGEIQPLVCEGGTVDLGNVEVIMLAPKKGGKK